MGAEPHVSDEDLAAFSEARLQGEERERVVEHLADCASCRSLLAEVMAAVDGDRVVVSRAALLPLAEIGARIRTQDNRITSHPLFLVQERRQILPEGSDEPIELWEFSDACFTEAGAEAIIARHRHNLHGPRVYVSSGFRNEEWRIVREFLFSLADPGSGMYAALHGREEVVPGPAGDDKPTRTHVAKPAAESLGTSPSPASSPSPRDAERDLLAARFGECCGGADPYCTLGCLVVKAMARAAPTSPARLLRELTATLDRLAIDHPTLNIDADMLARAKREAFPDPNAVAPQLVSTQASDPRYRP